jgi:predicted MPP superfamily phosphohydrolase
LTDLETSQNPNLPSIPRAGFFRAFADYWWGGFKRIAVRRYGIESAKIPVGTALKIAFVSDLHADTRFMPPERIRQVVKLTNELGADLIVLGGDYLTQDNWRMTPLPLAQTIDLLRGLSAPLGIVAIMGNHDWWDDHRTQTGVVGTPETVGLMLKAGFKVMRNEAVSLEHPSGVWLGALDSQMAFERSGKPHEGVDDLDATLNGAPSDRFNVLLAHEPDIFAQLANSHPRLPVDLVMSGHTHGGQIRIFGARPVVPSAYGAKYAYGHLHEDGRDLIVSGGLGCSSVPLRLGVMPEVVLVTLSGAK